MILLPSPCDINEAMMIDLGRLHLENETSEVEKDLFFDLFALNLEDFKVSRYKYILCLVTSINSFGCMCL